MAERLKPKGKLSNTGRITSKTPTFEEVPAKTEKRFTVGQWLRYEKGRIEISPLGTVKSPPGFNYRIRANQSIPQRDYFVGNVHIAYCRVSQKIYHLFITNGNEEVSIKGVHFDTENAMHDFILKELMS